MATRQSETNYATPENIIAALKQSNREKDAAIDSFAETNVKLRQKIGRLTNLISVMRTAITETTRKLDEVVERHTLL